MRRMRSLLPDENESGNAPAIIHRINSPIEKLSKGGMRLIGCTLDPTVPNRVAVDAHMPSSNRNRCLAIVGHRVC